MGQIPILDVCEFEEQFLQAHAWAACADRSPVLSWVDNLFWFAKSIYSAVAIGTRIEKTLNARWRLELKSDSKILQPGLGCEEPCDWVSGWRIATSAPYLGHIVQTNCSIRGCWQAARTKMWKAFWANSGSMLGRRLPVPEKFALLRRCVAGVAAYRMSRWPPQAQIARELDSVQAEMSALILGLRPRALEDIAVFCRRRARTARAECRKQGLWSDFWFSRAVAWDKHMTRHPDIIATMFRNYHDSSWLERCRAIYANAWSMSQRPWTTQAGRTGTRAAPGFVAQRWQSGILFAHERLGA